MATRIQSSGLQCLCRASNPTQSSHLRSKRCFSSTPVPHMSRMRRAMIDWLHGPGAKFKKPKPGAPHYLGAYGKDGNPMNKFGADLTPFPLNPYFKSQAVLSEDLRDEIYRRVVADGQTVREVSIALGVTMERIGAVVRLKTIEQEWLRNDKPLNKHYQDTVMGMLPQTRFDKSDPSAVKQHETINDLPVHQSTLPQFFLPTSESRHFTREDASRVFHPKLLPADARLPHPEMIEAEKDINAGYKFGEVERRQTERIRAMEAKAKDEERVAREHEEKRTTIVPGERWDFVFKDVRVEAAGKDGRGRRAAGWRYGAPHEDRKKGQIKIPTKVD